ncbi:hypothetical protein FLAG1_00801 [Fusarium langsethiae]|uniref:F-box domain-containing protein n=1 Tax=Fusarium langsethiae TaxID=179993 RepID=A0A0N0DHY9_FUSLA|nr:hypothetical protein FLAG1_00801 [Fusarium langsethiae]
MTRQHPIASFQGLPYDIHLEIGNHMSYADLLRLAATNRHFHKILDPKTIVGPEKALKFITKRDKQFHMRGHELFACSNCYKFLPRRDFPAVRADGGLMYYFCHNCGEYRTRQENCREKRIQFDTEEAKAEAIKSLCAPPRRQRQGLENFSAYTLAKISSFLDFQDVLNLAQVSRRLNVVVEPNNWVPLHTRYRYVHDKWTNDVKDLDFEDTLRRLGRCVAVDVYG